MLIGMRRVSSILGLFSSSLSKATLLQSVLFFLVFLPVAPLDKRGELFFLLLSTPTKKSNLASRRTDLCFSLLALPPPPPPPWIDHWPLFPPLSPLTPVTGLSHVAGY